MLTLTLNPNNPANTTLIDESGDTVYSISTTFDGQDVPTTTVYDGLGKRVADWRWKETSLDEQMLRFEGIGIGVKSFGTSRESAGKERVAAGRWLRKSLVPFNS